MNSINTDNLQAGFPANGDELNFINEVGNHLRQVVSSIYGEGKYILNGLNVGFNGMISTTVYSGMVFYQGETWIIPTTTFTGRQTLDKLRIDFSTQTQFATFQNGESLPAYIVRTATLSVPENPEDANLKEFAFADPLGASTNWERIVPQGNFNGFRNQIVLQSNVVININRQKQISLVGFVQMNFAYLNGSDEEADIMDLSGDGNSFPYLNVPLPPYQFKYRFPCMLQRTVTSRGIETIATDCQITPEGRLRLRVPKATIGDSGDDMTGGQNIFVTININFSNQ